MYLLQLCAAQAYYEESVELNEIYLKFTPSGSLRPVPPAKHGIKVGVKALSYSSTDLTDRPHRFTRPRD
jgi:hypothetical protein